MRRVRQIVSSILIVCMLGTMLPVDSLTNVYAQPTEESESGNSISREGLYAVVAFESNGGGTINPVRVRKGSKIGNCPIPYKENAIFEGWCYDNGLTNMAASTDAVTENTVLYAKYQDTDPIESETTPTFLSQTDVGTDFSITVLASEALSSEEVLQNITAKNLNAPHEENVIAVTGGDGTYTITGGEDGFEEGVSYKITLEDERLTFPDTEASIRDYNFTTKKAEVLNVTYQEDTVYIPMETLSDITNDGQTVDSLSIVLYKASADGSIGPADLTTGNFTYTEKELAVGDTVIVYAGVRPDQRTLDTPTEDMGDVAYITITEKNGAVYSYRNAQAEEVIFEPDMLPIPIAADTDEAADTVTVGEEYIDYSDDRYANIELDSKTTVDAGDFLVFYTGTFGAADQELVSYGEVVSMKKHEDKTVTITFKETGWDAVQAAMDAYANEPVEGGTLLANTDVEELETQVEEQARESGFAEAAGDYLANAAMQTDSFTTMTEDMDLMDYQAYNADGEMVSDEEIQELKGGGKVDVSTEVTKLNATLSTKLNHFEGYSGVRLTLDVGVAITITPANGDAQVELNITGSFEQEMRLDIGVSSKAVWKVWGIFPYIAEYRVTANVDIFDFTGIGIDVTMVTKEKDDDGWTDNEELKDFADQLKELLGAQDKYIGDGEGTVADGLTDKYKKMMETESDWVNLFKKEIFHKDIPVIPALQIIAIGITAEFVVQVNAVISLGMDYYYMNAKRYVYTIDVFAKKVYNDVIDIQEETYEFTFYCMGTLGLRAGIRLSISVGLFSTKVASVGFAAEVGAYVQLWGYFYYELKYTASQGRSQRCSGALYIEVGIYLEVAFEAQAFAGTFSTEVTLYDNEWVLYHVGSRDSILEFATSEADMPQVKLKQYIRNAYLTDDVFEMNYLDLKEGEEDSAVYDDASRFNIEMTNSKFTYNPANNQITVNPADGDTKLMGQMIITWKHYPLAFTSAPLRRVINLYWDNLRDGYVIIPYTNGGSYVPILVQSAGSKLCNVNNPVKQGYIFNGWYRDEELKETYTFPEQMPETDTTIYAGWAAAADTPYTVEHYKEVAGTAEYQLIEQETFQGVTGAEVIPETHYYMGCVTPSAEALMILPDGSAKLRYYYDLEQHTVTFEPGEAGGKAESYTLKYGATIVPPVYGAKGYTFTGWDSTVASNMGSQDLTYTAQWSKDPDTPYRVEYYVQQEDGRYVRQEMEEKLGTTGEQIAAESLRRDDLYTVENITSFRDVTVAGTPAEQIEITGDGKTVIKVNYSRKESQITFQPGYDGAEAIIRKQLYGQKIVPPAVQRTGYTFKAWTPKVAETVGAEDLTYTAEWTPNADTPYRVEHYVMDTEGNYGVAAQAETYSGETDLELEVSELVNESLLVDEGITFAYALTDGSEDPVTTTNIAPDGTRVVKMYYQRSSYALTCNANGGVLTGDETQQFYYGQAVEVSAPTRENYTFAGWSLDAAGTENFDGTMPAGALTIYAKWTQDGISYQVEHYLMDTEGAYPKQATATNTETGYAGDVITLEDAVRKQLLVEGGIVYANGTAQAEVVTETTLTSGDPLVIRLYYARMQYTATFHLEDGVEPVVTTVYYGGSIVPPVPERAGYSFTSWNESVPSVMPAQNLERTAQWKAKSYTMTFDTAGGSSIDQIRQDYNTEVTAPKPPVKVGYTFKGWDKELPKTMPAEDTSYKAIWEATKYTITYENMTGAVMEGNPDHYTVETETFTLAQPQKTGYSFLGWFEDVKMTKQVTAFAVPTTNPLNKVLYAKWEANPYSVTFDDGMNAGNATVTQMFTYDERKELEPNTFTRDGYVFQGWSLESGSGQAAYRDKQSVINLAESGNITLYAVWTAIQYQISYVTGPGAVTHNNPASYTTESNDINLQDPTNIQEGYQFLGWYQGDTQVTSIPKGSKGSMQLTAKWAHGGIFTVKYTSTSGNKSTYTITRTLPSGTIPTNEVQHVYYRTVNGTAIGGTAAPIHFLHVGGEDVFATFTADEGNGSTKTFTVTGENAEAAYSYNGTKTWQSTAFTDGSSRYYDVELYKIVDTQGSYQGKIGAEKTARRTLGVNGGYWITSGAYDWKKTSRPEVDVVVQGVNYAQKFTVNRWINEPVSSYLKDTITSSGLYVTANMWEDDDGYQYIRFVTNTGKIDKWEFEIKPGKKQGSEQWNIHLPYPVGGKQSDVQMSRHLDSGLTFVSNGNYVILPTDVNSVEVGFATGGKSGSNMWHIKNVIQYLRAFDTKEPEQVGIAPMAFGHYKAGDTIEISVVYDEIVTGISGTAALNIPGLSLSNVTYTGGTGTSMLTFRAVVQEACEITPDYNSKLITTKPVSGITVRDMVE